MIIKLRNNIFSDKNYTCDPMCVFLYPLGYGLQVPCRPPMEQELSDANDYLRRLVKSVPKQKTFPLYQWRVIILKRYIMMWKRWGRELAIECH